MSPKWSAAPLASHLRRFILPALASMKSLTKARRGKKLRMGAATYWGRVMTTVVTVTTSAGFNLVTLDTLYDDLANSVVDPNLANRSSTHFITDSTGAFNGHTKGIHFNVLGSGFTYGP